MPDTVRNIIYQFSQQMEMIFGSHLSKVIVYGSYARGDYQDNSDVDVMILVNLSEVEIKSKENMVYDVAFDIEMRTGIDIFPIIKNEDQYEYWVDVLPYYRNVREEGVIVDG
ncbi:MAG: nucleotidyltransferase domain-containing protein [Hespellia sp.]|nr:nucleotidyltransferase domain-containing protein [Hespellia sp.]